MISIVHAYVISLCLKLSNFCKRKNIFVADKIGWFYNWGLTLNPSIRQCSDGPRGVRRALNWPPWCLTAAAWSLLSFQPGYLYIGRLNYDIFENILKTILKLFWKYFEIILKIFWKYFENIILKYFLKYFWNYFENIF